MTKQSIVAGLTLGESIGGLRERRVTVDVIRLDASGVCKVGLVVRDRIGDLVAVTLSSESAVALMRDVESAVAWTKNTTSITSPEDLPGARFASAGDDLLRKAED